MSDMYVMCGICGSGKSFFAKDFAEKNGYRYLNIDDCYAVFNGDEKIHENKFEVWQLFFKLIHNAISLNQTVVVDTNAPLKSDREEFLNWFPEFEHHYLIWIDADKELAWKNNCNRSRVMSEESWNGVYDSFCVPTKDEPRGRSKWNYIVKIRNENNQFVYTEFVYRESVDPTFESKFTNPFIVWKTGMDLPERSDVLFENILNGSYSLIKNDNGGYSVYARML